MQGLEDGLEENLRMERYVKCLKQDLLVNDKEKNQCLARLNKAEHDVQVLTATVDTLSAVSNLMRCCAMKYSLLLIRLNLYHTWIGERSLLYWGLLARLLSKF